MNRNAPARAAAGRLLAIAVGTAVAATGCSASSASNAPRRAVISYTCCGASDLDRIYRPGDTVVLHWTADSAPGQTSSTAGHTVVTVGPTGS